MAFKTLSSGNGKAMSLDKKGMKIEGHLIAAKTGIGKFKSSIIILSTKEGKREVWSNGQIDGVLLDERGKGVNPELKGCLVRITCMDIRKEKDKKTKKEKTYRDFKVEADTGNKVGADYMLDKSKKFKK